MSADDTPITHFRGPYRFLSNFYPCVIPFEGETYPSVEHAYQAAKTTDFARRYPFHSGRLGPAIAKSRGGTLALRADWEMVKVEIMYALLVTKFQKNPGLRASLLDTGDRVLIEGTNWGDRFWGQDPVGRGENWLGNLLMVVRSEL